MDIFPECDWSIESYCHEPVSWRRRGVGVRCCRPNREIRLSLSVRQQHNNNILNWSRGHLAAQGGIPDRRKFKHRSDCDRVRMPSGFMKLSRVAGTSRRSLLISDLLTANATS